MLTCGIESGVSNAPRVPVDRHVFELKVNPTMGGFCDCECDPAEEETRRPVGDEGHRSEAISRHSLWVLRCFVPFAWRRPDGE